MGYRGPIGRHTKLYSSILNRYSHRMRSKHHHMYRESMDSKPMV